MFFILRKRTVVGFVLFCALLLCAGLTVRSDGVQAVLAHLHQAHTVVVIDAGHGGEDGGAVARDGTVESHINLAIAGQLDAVLRFLGQDTVMVRTTDISVYSEGAKTLHEKKVSDLQNRVALINAAPNGTLLSIHQNSMPGAPRVQGAQAFHNEAGTPLASAVQDALNLTINPEKPKVPKRIPDTIYLMKHVNCPAVLVECGFLSNPAETVELQKPTYQTRLAVTIAAGFFRAQTRENTPIF
ncbi:MAG: N-acetylmuramoyl-L-alanine amidase [Oscillospiraceae bacterium]